MSYGTSMVVGGHQGLGEGTAPIDWTQIIQGGIATGIDFYTAERDRKALDKERDYQLQLAKITQGRSVASAGDSSGETTSDPAWWRNNTGLIVGGVLGVGLLAVMAMRRR